MVGKGRVATQGTGRNLAFSAASIASQCGLAIGAFADNSVPWFADSNPAEPIAHHRGNIVGLSGRNVFEVVIAILENMHLMIGMA